MITWYHRNERGLKKGWKWRGHGAKIEEEIASSWARRGCIRNGALMVKNQYGHYFQYVQTGENVVSNADVYSPC